MKKALQQGIRQAHLLLLNKGLPERLGLYLHSLERPGYGAFQEMIGFFRSRGYRFVGPDAFLSESCDRQVFLSFDDNYRSWYEALPLLERLQVRATFYVNTLPMRGVASPEAIADYFRRLRHGGDATPLSIAELQALAAHGHTIGAHTHSHLPLCAMPLAEAQAEILRSKALLEAYLGRDVRHFSYPFGMRRFFSEPLRAFCMEAGFATVANAIPGLQHAPHSPRAIQRSGWDLGRSLDYNLASLSVDGRFFERLSGRSAVS